MENKLSDLKISLYGDPIRQQFNESTIPSIQSRVGGVAYGHWETRQNPTETQKQNLQIAQTDFENFKGILKTYFEDLETFEAALEAADAPYTPGRKFD